MTGVFHATKRGLQILLLIAAVAVVLASASSLIGHGGAQQPPPPPPKFSTTVTKGPGSPQEADPGVPGGKPAPADVSQPAAKSEASAAPPALHYRPLLPPLVMTQPNSIEPAALKPGKAAPGQPGSVYTLFDSVFGSMVVGTMQILCLALMLSGIAYTVIDRAMFDTKGRATAAKTAFEAALLEDVRLEEEIARLVTENRYLTDQILIAEGMLNEAHPQRRLFHAAAKAAHDKREREAGLLDDLDLDDEDEEGGG